MTADHVALASDHQAARTGRFDRSRHRNLFNGDWGTFFWAPGLWQPEGGRYCAKAVRRCIDLLADSGVDTFLISTNTQVAWHTSKAIPTALDGYTRGDARWDQWMPGIAVETNRAFIERVYDLAEDGVDWLGEAITACRGREISPWASVRMNDMHGAGDPTGNPINCPLFGDPRNRLAGTPMNPRDPARPYWGALSYERREVRDYMMAMIRELIADYAFEGMELDWLRNPAICEPGASPQTVDAITAWIAQVRALTEARAAETGRPYPLGLRIPGQLPMLRDIGLDVKAIVRAGLVDFVSPSNFMQTAWDMPHDQLRAELGDGVAIYGVTELIFNGVRGYAPETDKEFSRYPCASAPALRANAAGKLVLGADGIEQYNYYAADEDNADERIISADNMRADYSAIRGVCDLEGLRGLPKHYGLGTLMAPCWYPPFELPEPLPVVLEPEWRRAFRLPMCAEPTDRDLELVVQVVLEGEGASPEIGVSFGGSWPSFDGEPTRELLFPNRPATHHTPGREAWNFHFDVGLVREGWNEITVYNGSHERETVEGRRANSITIASIELAISRH